MAIQIDALATHEYTNMQRIKSMINSVVVHQHAGTTAHGDGCDSWCWQRSRFAGIAGCEGW